jgi:hypothetical protein
MHAMYEDYSSQVSLRIMRGVGYDRGNFDGMQHTVRREGEVYPNYANSGE